MMALWTTVKTSSILRLYAQCDEILFEGAFQIHFYVFLVSLRSKYILEKNQFFYMLKILLFHARKLLSFVEFKDKK